MILSSKILKWLAAGIVLLLIVVMAFGAYGVFRYQAPGPLDAETTLIVPSGSSVRGAARVLEGAGALDQSWLFVLAARASGSGRDLKAGEYEIPGRASVQQLLAILRSGKTVQRSITIAEGLTSAQIIAILNRTDGLVGPVTAIPPEGSLLPETYFFSRGDPVQDVIDRMQADRDAILQQYWMTRAPDLPLNSPEAAVILASIIEKETAIPAERGRIAAVFINRLDRGMRLQSDPTVIYSLTGGKPLGRPIRRSELDRDHPFNTYKRSGLPPHPIANPGRDSIYAALNPDDSMALYFVADGSGGHVFADNLEDHNRNAAAWRRYQKRATSGADQGETENR